MSEWTDTDRRIGKYSAISVVAIVIVYVITGLIGLAARPPLRGTQTALEFPGEIGTAKDGTTAFGVFGSIGGSSSPQPRNAAPEWQ